LGVSKGAKAKSSMEFEREWRRMGKDPQERYRCVVFKKEKGWSHGGLLGGWRARRRRCAWGRGVE
jgi:hypothetical protein